MGRGTCVQYKLRLLNHAMAIQALLPRYGARASMSLETFSLEVRAGGRRVRFAAQFYIVSDAHEARYAIESEGRAFGFIGWLPYFNKRWPAATGKFAFKAFCAEHDLPTPAYSRSSPAGMPAFLVKNDRSSFGRGMRGPFRADGPGLPQSLGEAEYYEQFIAGRILKAWYWDERLVCLEAVEPPTVKGDGKSTVRALIERRLRKADGQPPWDRYACCAAFHGVDLDSVLEPEREIFVEILYGSRLHPSQPQNTNCLAEEKKSTLGRQLAAWGPALLASVPPQLRGVGTMYTVDAMADAADKVWLLEMNCNPTVHPDTYAGMFEGLFRALPAPGEVPAGLLRQPAPGLALAMPPEAFSRPWAIS